MENPFPGTNIPTHLKETKDFANKVGLAVYNKHMYHALAFEEVERIHLNRQHAANQPPIEHLKTLVDPYFNQETKEKSLFKGSLVNISWKPWSPCKKFVNSVVGAIIETKNVLRYNAIDRNSRQEKERKKNELLSRIYAKDMLEQLAGILGQKEVPENAEEAGLDSSADVEMYMQMKYRLMKEIAMEKLVSHVFKGNKYYEEIEPRIVHDLVENNKLLGYAIFDKNDRIKIKYGDIAAYVRPASDDITNRNNDYDGLLGLWTINEIRDFVKDKKAIRGADGKEANDYEVEKVLYQLAEKVAGRQGNPQGNFVMFDYRPAYGDYFYNDFRVEALWINYYTINSDFVRIKENGEYIDIKHSIPEKTKHEYVRSEKEVCYEGLFVPAINETLGWCLQENMVRPYTEKGGSAELSRRFFYVEPTKRMGRSSSLVDDMVPDVEDILVSIYKIRQLVAESRPPGYFVDWFGLNEVFTAMGEKVEPSEIIRLYQTKGIGFYVSRTDDGHYVNAPIHEVKSDFGPNMRMHLEHINSKMVNLRESTGVNDAIDGSVQSRDALVGIQKMKAMSGHRLLRELFNAYNVTFLQMVGDTVRDMIQTQIRNGMCEEEYRQVIGDSYYEVLKMDDELAFPVFGTHVESLPDESELQMMERQIEIGLQAGTIRPSTVIDVRNLSNVKEIMQLLKFEERKAQQSAAQSQQMAVELEAQKNMSSADARAGAEERIIEAKKIADMEKETQRHNNKMAEIDETKVMEGSNKLNEIHATADRDDKQIEDTYRLEALYSKGEQSSGTKTASDLSRKPKTFRTPPRKATQRTTESVTE